MRCEWSGGKATKERGESAKERREEAKERAVVVLLLLVALPGCEGVLVLWNMKV